MYRATIWLLVMSCQYFLLCPRQELSDKKNMNICFVSSYFTYRWCPCKILAPLIFAGQFVFLLWAVQGLQVDYRWWKGQIFVFFLFWLLVIHWLVMYIKHPPISNLPPCRYWVSKEQSTCMMTSMEPTLLYWRKLHPPAIWMRMTLVLLNCYMEGMLSNTSLVSCSGPP